MEIHDAAALIAGGLPARRPGAPPVLWADLGAGGGTFTAALAWLLGLGSTVVAVDRDPRAADALRRHGRALGGAAVDVRQADFDDARGWDALALPPLDGILLANALHFVPAGRQEALLARLVDALAPGGRLLVVEYEGRSANPWVPHPVSRARLQLLAPAGTAVRTVGNRASAFGGTMYAAAVEPVERAAPPDPVPEGDDVMMSE